MNNSSANNQSSLPTTTTTTTSSTSATKDNSNSCSESKIRKFDSAYQNFDNTNKSSSTPSVQEIVTNFDNKTCTAAADHVPKSCQKEIGDSIIVNINKKHADKKNVFGDVISSSTSFCLTADTIIENESSTTSIAESTKKHVFSIRTTSSSTNNNNSHKDLADISIDNVLKEEEANSKIEKEEPVFQKESSFISTTTQQQQQQSPFVEHQQQSSVSFVEKESKILVADAADRRLLLLEQPKEGQYNNKNNDKISIDNNNDKDSTSSTTTSVVAAAESAGAESSASMNILAFCNLLGKLKHLPRAGWLRHNIEKPEPVAGHMYRMAVLAFCLDDLQANGTNKGVKIDKTKCIKMALVHDMAESIVGDITPHCGISADEKYRRENEGMLHIASLLKGKLGSEMYDLWHEYETQSSPEAVMVKQLDKFDLIAQAYEYERETDRPKSLQEFFNSTTKSIRNEPVLSWTKKLLQEREDWVVAGSSDDSGNNSSKSAVTPESPPTNNNSRSDKQ